eukprot:TRINITY_DN43188_c0_g1_i1.p1 TRINITY_DN43188_c0_g1~~TRINITY_DN43188_c0_g1_i1.p1  ORF type:complete len:334 (+),score=56.04 TRINITY_DN43188_c0_g1_i1:23-1003(+)
MVLALRGRDAGSRLTRCVTCSWRMDHGLEGLRVARLSQPRFFRTSALSLYPAAAAVGAAAAAAASTPLLMQDRAVSSTPVHDKRLVAAVLGATGAVGQELVRHMIERDQWSRIIVLNRRHVEYESEKVEEHIIDMSDSSDNGKTQMQCEGILMNVDALFNTMGVGAASKVSEESLRNVDVSVPSAVFRGAKAAGVRHASILSAVGADKELDPDAGLSLFGMLPKTTAGGHLYNHCKGMVEHNVHMCGFASVSSFRPAALIGTPHTPGVIAMLSPVLDAVVPIKYKSSHIRSVALAMVKDAEISLGKGEGVNSELSVFEGHRLHALY